MKTTLSTAQAFALASLMLLSCHKQKEVQQTTENGAGPGTECTSCVHYVKKVLGIVDYTNHALNWGTVYPIPNYSQVTDPQNDDIIVITPSLTEWSASSEFRQYGHVGFVKNLVVAANGDLSMEVKGGNQGGSVSECGCSQVNLSNLFIANSRRNLVRFYRNTNPGYNCPGFTVTPPAPPTPIRIINLSGDLNFGNVIIGNTPSRPMTITNNGNSTLTVSSVSLPNGYTSDYASGTIPAGNSTTANIRFTPLNTVSVYNGTITVSSNSTSGGNTMSVTGSGVNGTPAAPVFSPSSGTSTSCSFGDQTGTGGCAGSLYRGGTIKMRVSAYNPSTNTISFTIEKCSGSFSNSGTVYLKQGDYCGTVVSQTNYSVGASSVVLNATPALAAGHYTYTAVIVSATTDKYYSMSIQVQY